MSLTLLIAKDYLKKVLCLLVKVFFKNSEKQSFVQKVVKANIFSVFRRCINNKRKNLKQTKMFKFKNF